LKALNELRRLFLTRYADARILDTLWQASGGSSDALEPNHYIT
jgi:hypothetical protein